MTFEEWLKEEEKKKKKNTVETTTTSKENLTFNEWLSRETGAQPVQYDDIAPVRETEERTWFKKGAFDDGYDFGDITKTVLGTLGDTASDLVAGATGIVESTIDAGAYLLGGAAKMSAGRNTALGRAVADNAQEFIKKDIIDEKAVADTILLGLDRTNYEDYSVFGDKTDSLVQSGGQLLGTVGLQALGVPWFVTTGVTSFGSGTEEAFKEDATYGEAGLSATIQAGADILTEKLFGGSGLGEKGLLNLDGLTKGISSKVVKSLADFGLDMAAEGAEEVAASVMTNLGSALYKEENLGDLLFSEEAVDEYIENFIGGAVLGGGMNAGKLGKSIKSGRDYRTGLNTAEEKVFNKAYEDAIAEAERSGKKLTKDEKAEIYDSVMEKLDKGYISTDTIEEVLGGRTFTEYKSLTETKKAITDEISQLENLPKEQITVKQSERLTELREELKNLRNDTELKKTLSDSVYGIAKNSRLVESYNEIARKGQAFEVDLNKYKGKQRTAVERAMKSGVLNNTNRSHELVDILSKIEADKGIIFDYTDNAKLKASGFAVEGKTVNGFEKNGTVTLNVQSAKAWQSTVGHEITHVLEGTSAYTELRNALYAYAESKGELASRKTALTELYKDMDADIDAELTADLVGDYLFGDKKFISNLTTNKTVFQKIWDEVKYLCKVATGKEKASIEKVEREFAKVWENFVAEEGKKDGKTNLSMSGVNAKTADNSLLLKAEDMLNKGTDSETVRQETGWHKGYDGKMRFEIDDSEMDFNINGHFTNPDVIRHRELEYKFLTEPENITEAEISELQSLSKALEGVKKRPKTLGDYLKHDKLFKAYPELKNTKLTFDKLGDGSLGKYRIGQNEIVLDNSIRDDNAKIKTTLIHEIQHAIQKIEGFANGASPEYWQEQRQDIADTIQGARENLNLWLDDIGYRDYVRKSIKEVRNNEKTLEQHWKDLEEFKANSKYAEQIAICEAELAEFQRQYDEITNGMTAYEQYQNTAGEIEARDAENRLNLTAEERKNTRPDIDKENVVFADTKYSVSADSEGNQLSKEQSEYFQDSKAVDEDGNLRVVYHGTYEDFNVFDIAKTSSANAFGKGHYFTSKKADAQNNYATMNGADVHTKIEELAWIYFEEMGYTEADYESNDAVEEWNAAYDKAEEFYKSGRVVQAYLDIKNPVYARGSELYDANGNFVTARSAEYLKKLGYDGIIDYGVADRFGHFQELDDDTVHYVVFDSNQIKLTTNKTPTTDPDIRYSVSNIAPTNREYIKSKLSGREISEQAYVVLDKLQRGESVALEDLEALPEVIEGSEKVKEYTDKFLESYPEFKNVPEDKLGTYLINSAEREQLRSDILQDRLKSGSFTGLDNDGKEVYNGDVEKGKRLDIVIGLPAAGKSTSIVNPLSQYYKSVVVDSDIIKGALPEFNEGWGASLVHEESSNINAELFDRFLQSGSNIVLPIVGSKVSSVEKYLNLAKAQDYEVHLHLNELNSSKAMGRMIRRYFNDGRFIPPSVSYKYGDKPTAIYEEMKNRGDINGYSHWNNDVQKGQRPTLTDISESNRTLVEYSRTWRASRGTDSEGGIGTSSQGTDADFGNGVGGLQERLATDDTGRRKNPEGSIGLPKFVRLTPKTQEALSRSGVVSLELIDSSDDSNAFSIALNEARTSDEKNGWAVTPKTAEELVEYNVRTIMTSDSKAGLGVAPDGDIEAVFKNQNGGKPKVLDTLIPAALEMGGNKLDCYGTGLVRLYSNYGFVPVARLTFNPEYANEGWTKDKGTPDIFFMVHNGDSADTVVANKGKYKEWTTEELNALPLFDKEAYDDAYAYRDSLLANIAPIKESLSYEGEQPSSTGTPLQDLYLAPTKADISKMAVAENATTTEAPIIDNKPPKSVQIADGTRGEELLNESLDNYPMETIEQRVAENIRAVEGELADNMDLRREAEANYNEQIEKLREQYNAKKNKNTKAAYNLLQSISRLERLKASADAKFAKRISDLEARVEKMKDPKFIRAKYKQAKMQEHAKWAADTLGDTTTWKDKKTGFQYASNTERRNLRDIVRDENGNVDIARADAIDDALNGRYNREETAKKRELAEVRKKYADLKINNKESAYIQMLGELRGNPETTLTEKVVNEYYEQHKNKIDKAKVEKALEYARQDYDNLIKRVNAELSKQGMKEIPYRQGYFPHFTEPKQNFIQKLLNWKTQDNEIPTSIAGLTETFRPVKSWQSFDKTRYSDETDYDFLKGFDSYSEGALDWIHHLDTLQKRRAVENHIRFTHSDEGIQARIKEVYANEEMDADEAQAQIENILAEAKNPLNNFVQDFTTHTNILAGKKNSLDRTVEQLSNRKIYSIMSNVQNRTSANMVLANVRSALTNFIPITQSWAQVSPMRSLQATKDTIANAIKDDGTINKSTFLTNRLREADKLYQTNWDKVLDKAGIMFEIVDNFSSQVIWRSKYNDNLAKGMSEAQAIKNADQFAENVMAGRSKGNEPTIFNAKNPFVKAFTMFQLEVNNQYGYLFKDVPNDLKAETEHWKFNLAKGYTTAFIGAYVYNTLLEQVAGSGAALDPIGIIEDLLKDLGLFDDDEEEEPKDVVMNLIENVGGELPFVGGTLFGGGRIPLSSALPYGDNGLVDGIGNFVADVTEGNWGNIGKEMMNPVLNVGLPVGGGQLKKTVQGLSMFNTDEDHPVMGSYTDSGALRFPVDDTIGNRIQAGIFGQWANKNAREYIDNGYAPLKEKQIQEYMDVDMPIKDYWEYREGLKGLKKTEEKFDYIDSLDLPLSKKNILANNVTNRKDPVDLEGYGDFSSLEEFDYATKNPEKYAFAKSVGGYSAYKTYSDDLYDIKADKDVNGKSITGSRKEKVINYINNLDADYETKIILFKSEYPSDDTYNRDIINYLNNREDLTYEERVAIYTELGFTVKGGYVYWD